MGRREALGALQERRAFGAGELSELDTSTKGIWKRCRDLPGGTEEPAERLLPAPAAIPCAGAVPAALR